MGIGYSVSVNLENIVHHGKELPLRIGFYSCPYRYSVEAEGMTYVCKHGLHRSHSSAVNEPAQCSIELRNHSFGVRPFCSHGCFIENRYLSKFASRTAQAFLPDVTNAAFRFPTCVHNTVLPLFRDKRAVFHVQRIARWTRERPVGFVVFKIRWAKVILFPYRRPLAINGFFVSVCTRKFRVAFTKIVVGHVPIDAFLNKHLHVRFAMEATVRGYLYPCKYIVLANRLKVFPHPVYHRLQQPLIITIAKRLSMNNHLAFFVNSRRSVVSLHHPVRAGHFCALIIRNVALLQARPALSVLIFSQPPIDLF